MMHGHEKSDPAIVAVKPANKAERSAAELVEPRAGTEGNAGQLSTRRTPVSDKRVTDVGSHTVSYRRRTRGGSRMRESRTYGSVRGREVTRVPTANEVVCCGAKCREWHIATNRGAATFWSLLEA